MRFDRFDSEGRFALHDSRHGLHDDERILLNAETERHHIDHWIGDDGKNTRTGLAAVFVENSRQIVAVLRQPVGGR